MKPLYLLLLAVVVAAGIAGILAWTWPTSPPQDGDLPPPWFADITDKVGLSFVHDAGPVGSYFMPQAIGSGAAFFDANGDGRLDIYLLQNGGPNGHKCQLFLQERDGTFKNASAGSGLDIAGHNMGVAIGDVNNDGFPDVLVTQFRGVRLFLNDGKGVFTDVTEQAGLGKRLAWGTSAAFFDYDRDGWLDLVVVNYVDYDETWPCNDVNGTRDYCPPKTFPGQATWLFHNQGARGQDSKHRVRFKDVTVDSGLARLPGPGLGVFCADFDGDGWPDVFVANDGQPNRLWINKHNGTFKEEGLQRGLAVNKMGQAEAGMGVGVGDVDGDGLFDIFVTHLTEETNTLWQQGPRGLFVDRTADFALKGLRWRGTGFGTVLADFDHDGLPDIAIANGRVSRGSTRANPDLGPHWGLYAERNQLLANKAGHFEDLSPANPELCGTANVARGLACADIDGDGALDLLVTTAAGAARLYRNVAPSRGHWLLVRAVGPTLPGSAARPRDAYGAEIHVQAGDRKWTGLINPGSSYLCSNDPRAHFGLGKASAIDVLEVVWPDGKIERFDGALDKEVCLQKGMGKPVPKRK